MQRVLATLYGLAAYVLVEQTSRQRNENFRMR
jgi:hypothetical protein